MLHLFHMILFVIYWLPNKIRASATRILLLAVEIAGMSDMRLAAACKAS
ncbi:hypothetical protein [Paraburkholderia phenoliruptrix]